MTANSNKFTVFSRRPSFFQPPRFSDGITEKDADSMLVTRMQNGSERCDVFTKTSRSMK